MKAYNWMMGVATLLFLFSACEKEWAGGPARVSIAIADIPYNEGESPNRGAGKPRSETVVVPLEGGEGWCLSATLEETVETGGALRAFTQGARLRIAVYDTGNSCVKDAIGTFADGTFTLDTPTALDGLSVGTSYTFVAYSLNDTGEDPNMYRVGEALEDVDPAKDLLYGKSAATVIASGVNSVTIPLKHKFSQVTLVADASAIGGANITAISAGLVPAYTADLQLIGAGAGVLVAGASGAVQDFVFSGSLNTPTVTSDARTVFADGADPVKVAIHSVEINGGTSFASNDEVGFATPLALGTKYTLTLSFIESITERWAGSNIYWDGARLTFDPMGKTEHSLYQGVYFKFGSLVGVSGSEAMNANTTTMYVPDYEELDPEGSGWRASTISAEGWGDWDGIPYIPVISGSYPTYLYDLSDAAHYEEMKGDICRYIGETGAGPKGYRMPYADDFGAGMVNNSAGNIYWDLAGTPISLIPGDDGNYAWSGGTPAGTSFLSSFYVYLKANNNVRFPASGGRIPYDNGGRIKGQSSPYLGNLGWYRGSSINGGGDSVFVFEIREPYGKIVAVNMSGMVEASVYGIAVRCIKKLSTE
jgi:hypothetical protein